LGSERGSGGKKKKKHEKQEAASLLLPSDRSVGFAPSPSSAVTKVRHPSPMLSLDSVNSKADLEAWGRKAEAKLLRARGEEQEERQRSSSSSGASTSSSSSSGSSSSSSSSSSWVVEPKMDGLALRLQYRQGKLVLAATRGDGRVGEDVSAALLRALSFSSSSSSSSSKNSSSSSSSTNDDNNKAIPLSLRSYRGDADVRGEVFMTRQAFERANEEAAAEGRALPFSNPRNLAAATLRAGSGEDGPSSAAALAAERRSLSFAAYSLTLLGGGDGEERGDETPGTHAECLQWLSEQGVGVPDSVSPSSFSSSSSAPSLPHSFASFDAAVAAAEAWMATREALPYDVDGAVLKVDDRKSRAVLGDSPSAPRWAVAWKFRAAEAATRLEGVSWQLGRSGALVPVAELEPVAVGGVTVARASLHNAATLRRLKLRRGEMVVVRRAGDVVPQVVGAVRVLEGEDDGGGDEANEANEAAWLPPTKCPACGTELVAVAVASSSSSSSSSSTSSSSEDPSSADILRCPAATTCPGRALKRAQHFASAIVADSLERNGSGSGSGGSGSGGGAGPATVAAIVDAGLASDAADLVSLTPEILLSAKLPGFGAKRAAKVAAALSAEGAAPGAVLAGLGVPGVGRAAADALLSSLGSLRAVARAGASELEQAPGIGPVTAASIEAWFAVDDNARMVERLLEKGVGAAEVEKVVEVGLSSPSSSSKGKKNKVTSSQLPLSGLSFVITGTVPNATRNKLKAAVKAAGGTAASAVSSKTTAVVVGEAPGKAKVDAAEDLGVQVIQASDFFDEEGKVVWRKE
jgi:DNA ligase (NAD+)